MQILHLKLENFRNYNTLDLDFAPGINMIYGLNGQGKTNIAEAIYFFAVAKSHRVLKDRDLIMHGKNYAKMELETGRTHQIRVHMSYIGHPIMGDTTYGGGKTQLERSNASLLNGQMLHAKILSFPHPKTGEIVTFECELPSNFKTMLERLEKL